MSWHDYFLLSVSGNRLSDDSLQTFASSSASSHTFCMHDDSSLHCFSCPVEALYPLYPESSQCDASEYSNNHFSCSRLPYLVKLRILSAISFWTWHSRGTFPLRILPVCWERLAEPQVCKIFNAHLWHNLDSILGGGWAHEDLVVDHVLQLLCWRRLVDHHGGNQPWTRGQTSSSRISNIFLKGAGFSQPVGLRKQLTDTGRPIPLPHLKQKTQA